MTYQCGKFEVQEISTLSGYVLDDKIYTVNFEKEDNTTKEYTYTLDCQNLMTTIEFSKIDIENNYIEKVMKPLCIYEETKKQMKKVIKIANTYINERIEKGS